jgi:hypothetical protein
MESEEIMKLGCLKLILNSIKDDDLDVKIVAQTYLNGTVGGTDSIGIHSVGKGFDWDKGKFFIFPEIELRAIEYKKYNESIINIKKGV